MHEDCESDDGQTNWVWEPTKKFIKAGRYRNWSKSGAERTPQPDDFTTKEECIGYLNNWYNDGVKWHDLNCQAELPFVCERRL